MSGTRMVFAGEQVCARKRVCVPLAGLLLHQSLVSTRRVDAAALDDGGVGSVGGDGGGGGTGPERSTPVMEIIIGIISSTGEIGTRPELDKA